MLEEKTKEFIKRIHSLSKYEKDTLPSELFIDLLEVEEYFNWLDEKGMLNMFSLMLCQYYL